MNRRQLLVKVGSWMKYSWRKSKESLMDGVSEDGDDEVSNKLDHSQLSDEKDDLPKKHVHFCENDNDDDGSDDHEDGELIVTEISSISDHAISEEDARRIWYHDFDFKRFEKDRVLTSMDYSNSRKLNKTFVEDEHSVRGIEHLCDASLQRRQQGERKDLYKALKAEEDRQKETGCFPDLDRFRAISLRHTRGGRERARTKALEDAKEQQSEMRRSASMRNLFGMRTQRKGRSQSRSQSRPRRRQSI
ncbi:MAG: hypothetical protein SGARI_004947, partial [Bacillariaceae sp.]